MSRRYNENLDAKVYVGGLAADVRVDELEEIFRKYGHVRKTWVARKPPGFAFIEFEDPRDAEDAVKECDGIKIAGERIRVEMSNGRKRNRGGRSGGDYDRGRSYGGSRYNDRERRYSRSPDGKRYRSRSPEQKRCYSPRDYKEESNREDRHRSRSPYDSHQDTYRERSPANSRSRSR